MKKIGIIGAMELEVETLKSKLKDKEVVKCAGMEFNAGLLGDTQVVVVRSGVGKVNAALCTQILADRFEVTHIINTGVAGSLNADINIGDIVLSTDAVYHDVDACIFGYKPGEVPQMGKLEFPGDSHMCRVAEETCREVCPELGVFRGRICSGDQFVASSDTKDRITSEFHGMCCEMEGCAIAHAAYVNDIPVCIIRAISDKADGSAEVDYPVFEKAAAEHSAVLVEAMVGRI